jgi:hypothetical protein
MSHVGKQNLVTCCIGPTAVDLIRTVHFEKFVTPFLEYLLQ